MGACGNEKPVKSYTLSVCQQNGALFTVNGNRLPAFHKPDPVFFRKIRLCEIKLLYCPYISQIMVEIHLE